MTHQRLLKTASRLTLPLLISGLFVLQSKAQEDLTPQVMALLEKQCKECHHPDTNDDFPYLHKGITIDDLIADEALVPGKPDESPVFKRIILEADSRKRMPKSRGEKDGDDYRDPLNDKDIDLVKNWILSLGKESPVPAPTSTTKTPPAPDAAAVALSKVVVKEKTGDLPAEINLDDKVHWIFENRCAKCHTGDYDPELSGSVNLAAFFTGKDSDGSDLDG